MRNHPMDESKVLAKIRAELDKHLRDHGAPEEVSAFLLRHWARLMAGIYLAKGNQHADWHAGWDTVNALLWTLSPRTGREQTETLLRILPTLLARLHQGCDALAIPAVERDALFELLAQMHAAIAREGLKFPAHGAAAGLAGTLDQEREANLSGLMPGAMAADDDTPAAEPVKLKRGSRIALTVHGEERIMVLDWISPAGGMYLFTNEQGLDALTFTRARLMQRLRSGEARALGAQPA